MKPGFSEYIIQQSRIYGKSSNKLTHYQQSVNKAAAELALEEPSLISSRQTLLDRARDLVRESGYEYKKGKSRSKKLITDTEITKPKRPKSSEALCNQRIKELEDDLTDFKDRLEFKGKRREQAINSRNFKLCDEITEEMSNIKHKMRSCSQELECWKRKQSQSLWYKNHRQDSSSSSNAVLSDDQAKSSTLPKIF